MLKVKKLTKLEERLCYDSWWLAETNEGAVKLHLYDGMRHDDIKGEIEACYSLSQVKDVVEPKCFYFD